MKKKIKITPEVHDIKTRLRRYGLHTVCEEARCPNLCECFSKGTATFMILGDVCTRSCAFCGVKSQKDICSEPDEKEPSMIATLVSELKLRHVVVTSVTRDDLKDEGANQFVKTIKAIRNGGPAHKVAIEVLTPDFHAREELLKAVCASGPDIYNHNIETVRRLSSKIRPQADYDRSLNLLKWVAKNFPDIIVKSGLIVGFGEKEEDVLKALEDLHDAGCKIVTIGQYFAPGKMNIPVAEYVTDEQFERYKNIGEKMGIAEVFSGRYVRSSYMAEELIKRGSYGS